MIIRIICSNSDCGYSKKINLEEEEEELTEEFLICPICDSILILPQHYLKD